MPDKETIETQLEDIFVEELYTAHVEPSPQLSRSVSEFISALDAGMARAADCKIVFGK